MSDSEMSPASKASDVHRLVMREPVAWRVTHYQDSKPGKTDKPTVTLTDCEKRARWIFDYYGRECSGVVQGKIEPLYL